VKRLQRGPLLHFDPFRRLTELERVRHLDAYRSWLEVRNGEIDLKARTLSRREAWFAELESGRVAWQGPIDRDAFFQRFHGTGRPVMDARTLWLVAIAKTNEGESYGVDLELRRFLDGDSAGADPTELHLFLEEQYHSRLLLEACRTCGLELEFQRPRWLMRSMIQGVYYLPDRMRFALALCGETLGATIFKVLLENCTAFAEEPAVEERLAHLIGQIWQDEVLHVAFLRARLGPLALGVARRMMPLVVPALMREVPHLAELGCDRHELWRRMRAGVELPPGFDWVESGQQALQAA
jgi:hypothetical protein